MIIDMQAPTGREYRSSRPVYIFVAKHKKLSGRDKKVILLLELVSICFMDSGSIPGGGQCPPYGVCLQEHPEKIYNVGRALPDITLQTQSYF